MNDRFIFYFVPKTGGTWSRAALRRGGVGGLSRVRNLANVRPFGLRAHHAPPAAVPDSYKKDRFQFCFVRRPYEWYQSFWAFRKKELALNEDVMKSASPLILDHLWDPDFRIFISRVLASCPGILTLMLQEFVGKDGKLMDFVGRTENLPGDLINVTRLIGYTDLDEGRMRRLKPMNVTGREFKKQAKVPGRLVDMIEYSERWILDTFYV
jgi:hypothetical protein